MNRMRIAVMVAASLGIAAVLRPVAAETDVYIGNIPPPPAVVFNIEPGVVVVPQSQVYYVPSVSEFDMYRYRAYWYINQGGYWYRSRAYRGPFDYVEYSRLPRAVILVPARYRRHPPHPPHPPHAPHQPHPPHQPHAPGSHPDE